MTIKIALFALAVATLVPVGPAPAAAHPPRGFLVDGPFSLMEEEGIGWDFSARPRP
jgi:hypothetical protein